jgi:hypothetical protein
MELVKYFPLEHPARTWCQPRKFEFSTQAKNQMANMAFKIFLIGDCLL